MLSEWSVYARDQRVVGFEMGPIIYFCGSIRGGRQDAELYARLIQKLKTYGEVLTEHIGNDEKIAANLEKMTDKDIYEQDMKWLERSDVVVAEVTQPSLGVGVEIGRAISLKKRTLCLFRPSSGKYLSALIRGAENGDQFVVKSYAEKEVDDILKSFLSEKQEEGSGDKAE